MNQANPIGNYIVQLEQRNLNVVMSISSKSIACLFAHPFSSNHKLFVFKMTHRCPCQVCSQMSPWAALQNLALGTCYSKHQNWRPEGLLASKAQIVLYVFS